METERKGFDAEVFYKALAATAETRGMTWKQVSAATGVSQSTLSRMTAGRHPDAASLTALAAWAGLDPTSFYKGARGRTETVASVTRLLRQDPNLDRQAAEAMEAIFKAAYERFKATRKDPGSLGLRRPFSFLPLWALGLRPGRLRWSPEPSLCGKLLPSAQGFDHLGNSLIPQRVAKLFPHRLVHRHAVLEVGEAVFKIAHRICSKDVDRVQCATRLATSDGCDASFVPSVQACCRWQSMTVPAAHCLGKSGQTV